MTTLRATAFSFLFSAAIFGFAFGQSEDSGTLNQHLLSAQRAAAAAHLSLAAARGNLQPRLDANLQYQALAARLKAAQQRVDDARASNSADLTRAATDKMLAATQLSNFVKDFGASDPVIVQAQKDADAADAAVATAAAAVAEYARSPADEGTATANAPEAAKEATIKTEYDKFNDETTVSTADDLSFSNFAPIGDLESDLFYTFKGQGQTGPPKEISLLIFSGSTDWVFEGAARESLNLKLIIDDDQRMSLPITYFNSKVADGDLVCRETLGYHPTYQQLKAIASAKKVEAKVFIAQFSFTPEQIVATKELVATMKPPSPTTMPAPNVVAAQDASDSWSGTGFFVSSDGLILTNRHVAVDEESPNTTAILSVFVAGYVQPFNAKIIGVDKDQDLALLKIQPSATVPSVHLSAEDFPSPGSECNILGFPLTQDLGMSLKITHGSVTSVHQSGADDPWATDGRDLMMDAKSNPGNSGGPLVNERGDVVGILAAKTATERFQESYTIGISTGHIRDFMRRCNVAIPVPSSGGKEMRPEDIFKAESPSVVRIKGQPAQ